jgi:hypothetical protein
VEKGVVDLMTIGKQTAGQRRPRKDISLPVTYFFQLGCTSYSFQKLPKLCH